MTNRRIALLALVPIAGLVFVIATVVVVLSLPDDEATQSMALAPTATAATAVTMTPAPTPTPPAIMFPAAPPVDTSRAVAAGQTTLLEVETGRVLRWENGENVQNARFSPDGRWLVYNQGWIPGENDLINSRIYRIDLSAPELRPQLIGIGFNPSISSRGDIAFNRQFDGQRAHVYVARLDGSVRRLNAVGATFTAPSWSPDGRWLVFASGYIGEGVDMPITLVDTTTWSEHVVDYIENCYCDTGYSVRWTPDSRTFASPQVHKVISATSRAVAPVPDASSWIKDNAVQEVAPAGPILRQVVTVRATPQDRVPISDVSIHDPATNTEVLLLTGVVGNCLRWSPEFRWLVADDFCDTI